jgi:hypothetical protein
LNPPSGGSAWRSTELLGFEYTAGGAFHFCPLLTWKESHPAFGGVKAEATPLRISNLGG